MPPSCRLGRLCSCPSAWSTRCSGRRARPYPRRGAMPEGDTIHYAANRMRPILAGGIPDEVLTPHPRFALDRWPERLAGRAVEAVDAHGKHLFVRFEGDLVIHSHLRMTGSWGTYAQGRRWRRSPRRAWLVLRARGHEVVQFDGPLLELQTASRARLDQRVAALGPDILAPEGRGGRAALPAAPARGRPHAADRRRAARPADDRRHRQPLEGRGVLRGRRRPLAPDGPRQRRGGAAHRGGHAAADAALRARRQPDALQDDLRPPGPPVPAVRDADRPARAGRRQPPDVLVPRPPAMRAGAAGRDGG